MEPPTVRRRLAAQRVRDFYAGRIELAGLLEERKESGDPDIEELLDLVEHEPLIQGFGGISPEDMPPTWRRLIG
jgi:hypothetical protein